MRMLKDMVVVITGASAGIGAELARQLSARGARLALSARRGDKLAALNAELGGGHLTTVADVAKQDDCQRLIDAAFERFGRIDTLVCNAGFGLYPQVVDTTPAEVRELFATNVFGTTDCIYAAAGRMLGQPVVNGVRGQIMLVSSAAARRGVPYLGVYSATKAAQLSIAEAMRVELRPQQLAVTSVHPIMTKTEFGEVAESRGAVKLPRGDSAMTQTVGHVARRMVRAIERPRPEVWPSLPARISLGVGTLLPGVMDRMLSVYRSKVEAANVQNPVPSPGPPGES